MTLAWYSVNASVYSWFSRYLSVFPTNVNISFKLRNSFVEKHNNYVKKDEKPIKFPNTCVWVNIIVYRIPYIT
jgi:hypothetical protein